MCRCEEMGASDKVDDVWGDADEAQPSDSHQTLDREWQARREEHFSSGYREGLEAGKHETVQEGFNEGYCLGAAAGFETGAARGAAATLRALAARLPADLSSRLQDAAQVQHIQDFQQQLEDVPYQQLQEQVCSGLMTASARPDGQQAPAPLPHGAQAGVRAFQSALQQLGLRELQEAHELQLTAPSTMS